MRWPGLSLRGKFFLLTSLGIVLLTVILGGMAALRSSQMLHKGVEKQGRILARTVAALIINELVYEKLGLVEEGGLIDNYVREIYNRRDLDLLYVAVLDENFRVISHNDFSYYGTIMMDGFAGSTVGSGEVSVRRIEDAKSGGAALEFAAPLGIAGKNWGALLFAVSLREVERETEVVIREIMVVMGGALLFGLGLIYLLGRRFIEPITSMAETMQAIDSELPDRRVEVRGEDELAVLGHSFNTMIERIRSANLATKQAHEKLRQSEKLATLGILSSSVAHRINNPLGGLFNCLRLLERHGDDPKLRRKYLELIGEGLESIRETVEQLLWTAGKRRSVEHLANAGEIFKGIMRFLDYRLNSAGISLQAEIPEDLTLPVEAHDLHEMLQNILVNAVQAMPNGGELQVVMGREHGQFVIKIHDSGGGIPPSELEHVFDLFYTTKSEGEGTGLGLWMSHELVKRYQGEIKLESSPEKGTAVTINIPEH